MVALQEPSGQEAAARVPWVILPVLAAAQFVVVLDASIVNIALPSIESDLGFSGPDLQWVINAYVLAFGGLLLLGGRLSDVIDGRSVFLIGLGVFCAASLVCGLAETPGVLLAGRAAQGVGAAMLSPAGLTLLTRNFTGTARAKALAAWGAVSGIAGGAGVLLGGVLTDGPGWPWIFFINIPVGVIVAVAAWRLVGRSQGRRSLGLDIPGAALITGAIFMLVLAVVRSEQDGWGSRNVIGGFVVAAALVVAFIVVEQRVRQPLIPLGVFRLRDLSAGNAVNLLLGSALLATFFLLTLYLQQVVGDSAQTAGIKYIPLAVAAFVGSGLCSAILPRVGAKIPLALGMTFIAVGLAWFSLFEADSNYWSSFFAPSVVWGIGLGLAAVSALSAATQDLGTDDESGLASGLVSTTQQVGGAIGLAVLSTFTFDRANELLATGSPFPVALLDGLVLATRIGAGIAVVAAILALVLLTNRRPDQFAGDHDSNTTNTASAG